MHNMSAPTVHAALEVEISAAITMSFQMVIKLLYLSACVCLCVCVVCTGVCFLASPALYIISSPIEAEDGGGGKLLSERLHKYSGYGGVVGRESNLFPLTNTHRHTF